MFSQRQVLSAAIAECRDWKAVILTISPDLETSRVKEIGDAIDRATRVQLKQRDNRTSVVEFQRTRHPGRILSDV